MEKLIIAHSKRFQQFKDQKDQIRRLWNIDQKSAELLYILVKSKNPQHILEIGTSNGYSAFVMSLATDPESCLIETIEVDESRYKMAVDNLAGIANIKQYLAKAEDLIPHLNNNYDMVFLDANKPAYIHYLELIKDKLLPNALIVADNICSHPETTIAYRKYVLDSEEFFSSLLEIDAGLLISVYNKK